MNPGHTGLEFYRAAPEGKLPPIGRKLDSQWEAEGAVAGMDGWRFLGRRMIRYMGLMNFPRYIGRESRDFFYLTLRHLLPGDKLKPRAEPAEPGEGEWVIKNLPQHGYPPAIATTWIRPDAARKETKVSVVKLDPRALRLSSGKADEKVVVSVEAAATKGPRGLWLGANFFVIGEVAPAKDIVRLASGHTDPAPGTIGAIGIDPGGMLVYAEVTTAKDPVKDGPMLAKLLESMGCKHHLFQSESWTLALGGERDLGGHPVAVTPTAPRLVRKPVPSVERIFPDTKVVAPSVWYPLQAKRVRYFHKPKAKEGTSEGGGEATP